MNNSKTQSIAIELPPQIQSIPFDCEKEFVSVKGELNRLTAYLGGLKKCERSAYLLPEHERIESKGSKKLKEAGKPSSYIYEINEAVAKADLINEVVADVDGDFFVWNVNYITSQSKVQNTFFKNSYKVLCVCEHKKILEDLGKHSAKSVVLRGNIPSEDYWKIRKGIENNLHGTKKLTLFLKEKEAIIMERFS
jgi:hypothetical protein